MRCQKCLLHPFYHASSVISSQIQIPKPISTTGWLVSPGKLPAAIVICRVDIALSGIRWRPYPMLWRQLLLYYYYCCLPASVNLVLKATLHQQKWCKEVNTHIAFTTDYVASYKFHIPCRFSLPTFMILQKRVLGPFWNMQCDFATWHNICQTAHLHWCI